MEVTSGREWVEFGPTAAKQREISDFLTTVQILLTGLESSTPLDQFIQAGRRDSQVRSTLGPLMTSASRQIVATIRQIFREVHG